MPRYLLYSLLIVLLLAAICLAVAFRLEGSRQRLAAEQAEADRIEERQASQRTVAGLRKVVVDLQKERTSRDEGLKREVSWLSIPDFPAMEDWTYPNSLLPFTGGNETRELDRGVQINGVFHHDAPNYFTSEDDFDKVVAWYRGRLEAFLKQTGNKMPKKPGWTSISGSKPEPLGIYVFQVVRRDEAKEVRTAALGIRAAGASLTVFVAQPPAGGAATKTMITLVRDRTQIRYEVPKSVESDTQR